MTVTFRRFRGPVLLVAVMLIAAGCGSRRSSGDLRAGAGLTRTGELAAAIAGERGTAADQVPNPGAVPAGQETDPGAGSPTSPAGSTATTALTSAAPGGAERPTASPASSQPNGAVPGRATPSEAPRPGSPTGATWKPAPTGTGGVPQPAPGVPRSPVVIGNVGTYTGPAGSSLADLPQGVQVWTKWINDKGGVNGHQVKLVVADDGGDQARHRSLVQQLVETQGAIALVGNGEVITGASSVEYLTRKGIPVLGNEGGSDWFYNSPTYFTHVPTGLTYWKALASSVAAVAKSKGKTKWASITCTEATTCADADRLWTSEGEMKSQGLQPVYNARASIAQPDFTAECLNARNAGAEIVTLVMDAATVYRISAACARQGYHPIFTVAASSAKSEHATDPNLAGGFIASLGHFVWTDSSTPATAEFQAAMKKYLGRAPGAGHAGGWSAARLFEKGAANLGEPATPQGVLDGLWSLKGETLDGLVMPLTFTRGQQTPRQICWATNYAEGGRWTPFDGGRISCRAHG